MQNAIEQCREQLQDRSSTLAAVQQGATRVQEPYCWQAFRALARHLFLLSRHFVLGRIGSELHVSRLVRVLTGHARGLQSRCKLGLLQA
jgi:hypothetical protein